MFDANKILGMLMESGMSRSGQSRVQRVAAGSGQSAGTSSADQNPRSGGSGDQSPGGSGGGFADIARSMLGGGGDRSPGSGQSPGGSGGGLAGLAGSLLGGGGRAGGAFSGGAMGLLGTLASAAMQHFRSGQGAAQPGLAEDAPPYGGDEAASDEQGRAMLMIRAMITAAKADGEIDPQERQRILGRLEQAGADPEAEAFVGEEMTRPVDLHTIVSAVDSPHTAIEVYAASLFAIDVDTPAEAAYMSQLAQGLGLNPTLVRELHASLEVPKPH